MSVKYSELPVTTTPAAANRVAVLDTADGTLKTTTLENAVKGAGVQSGFSGTTAEVAAAIQAGVIKEGMTVNITDDYEEGGGGGDEGTKLTQAQFDALPASQQNVGKYWITDGSSALTVDTELSTTSHNPVENGVITTEINKINTHLSTLRTQLKLEDMSTARFVFNSTPNTNNVALDFVQTADTYVRMELDTVAFILRFTLVVGGSVVFNKGVPIY